VSAKRSDIRTYEFYSYVRIPLDEEHNKFKELNGLQTDKWIQT